MHSYLLLSVNQEKYFLGAEFSAYITSNKANFASGSTGTAFLDQIRIKNYFDLVFSPGFYITDSVAAYIKGGVSYAFVKDSLNSPATFDAVFVTTNAAKHLWGFALGLGMRKFINCHFAVFVEYQFHDYGRINLPSFLNFTANYNHSVNVYSQTLIGGLSYSF